MAPLRPHIHTRASLSHLSRGISTTSPSQSRSKSFPDSYPQPIAPPNILDLGPNPNPQFLSVPPVATPSFTPRTTFDVSENLTRSYYLGHHASALSAMRTALSRISFVIEARDYRVPLTSLNPELDRALAGRPRIVVYTKCDLVFRHRDVENKLTKWHKENGKADAVLFHSDPMGGRGLSGRTMRSTKKLLDAIKDLRTESDDNPILGTRGLVVGMPNSGKSTLLNLLRSAGMKGEISAGDKGTKTVLRGGKRVTVHKKAQQTAPQPGVTRKMSGPIRILPRKSSSPPPPSSSPSPSPPTPSGPPSFPTLPPNPSLEDAGVYILDTPGVFVPFVPSALDMVKLALVGMIKDTVIHEEIVADYLLFRLNLENPRLYSRLSEPTNNVNVFLERIARRTGKLGKGASPLTDVAAGWVIAQWRAGYLGSFLLDEVNERTLAEARRKVQEAPGLSIREARLKIAEDRKDRASKINAEVDT